MAIFPRCKFQIELPSNGIRAGRTVEGTAVLTAEAPIPRAERFELALITEASAGYGSGKSRSVKRARMLHQRFDLALPGTLEPGEHRHAFTLDIPPWLPPAYQGKDCKIVHELAARVDVDWAIDPNATFTPVVRVPRKRARAEPLVVRSAPSFHDSVIIQVSLQSTKVVQGGTIDGSIALRGDLDAKFDAVELTITGLATIVLGRGDRRVGHETGYRIDAAELRGGANLPFSLPIDAGFPPTFRNGFLDHDVVLRVSLDVPWAIDPSFAIPLTLLPEGSTVEASEAAAVVGNERTRLLAAAMARETVLGLGDHPVLVEGKVGPATVRVLDGSRKSRIAVDVEIDWPGVDLGIALRPEGLLDFARSPLLPPAFAERFVLERRPDEDAPLVDDSAVARFVGIVLDRAEQATEVRLSDHHVGLTFLVEGDTEETYVDIATRAVERAEAIAQAIADPRSGLPIPFAIRSQRTAWENMARAHDALFVPTRPAIHGIVVGARITSGDERHLRATLRAVWRAGNPAGVRWDVDLSAMQLPKKVRAALADTKDGELPQAMANLSASFASVDVSVYSVTLHANGWHEDPRAWLPGLEAFFAWALEARGERRADSPYR